MAETGWPLIPREMLPAPVRRARTARALPPATDPHPGTGRDPSAGADSQAGPHPEAGPHPKAGPHPEPGPEEAGPDAGIARRAAAGRQLSIFGAETLEPSPADLAGLLAGPGRLDRMGGTARVSVPVDAAWRVHVLVNELVTRGLAVSWQPITPTTKPSSGTAPHLPTSDGGPDPHAGDPALPQDPADAPHVEAPGGRADRPTVPVARGKGYGGGARRDGRASGVERDDFDDVPIDFESDPPVDYDAELIDEPAAGAIGRPVGGVIGGPVGGVIAGPVGGVIAGPVGGVIGAPVGGVIAAPVGGVIAGPVGGAIDEPASGVMDESVGGARRGPDADVAVAPDGEAPTAPVAAPDRAGTADGGELGTGAETGSDGDRARGAVATAVFEVRTAYSSRLNGLARSWPAAADRLFLSGPRLRLWVAAAGRPVDGGYALGLDPEDDLAAIDAALVRAGLAGAVSDDRRAYLIMGRKRLARLAELVGDRPAEAPAALWPGGAPV